MFSPLDPVSGPLYFLGFLGGFPLVPISDDPSDWDWDNCSGFKKNKFRLIWCYILHTVVIVTLREILSLRHEKSDCRFRLRDNLTKCSVTKSCV